MAGTGNTSIKSYNFYTLTKVEASYMADGGHEFVDAETGVVFVSQSLLFINQTPTDVWFSFDGVNDAGRMKRDERLQMEHRRERKVWFRGTVGPTSFIKFWAF